MESDKERRNPNSKLCASRPDIWERAVLLSTKLTAYQYVPKIPDQQGTIYACGSTSYWPSPPSPFEKIQRKRKEISEYEEMLERERIREEKGLPVNDDESRRIIKEINDRKREIGELEKQRINDDIQKDEEFINDKSKDIERWEIEEELHKRRGNKEQQKSYRNSIDNAKLEIGKRKKRIEDNKKRLSAGSLLVPEGAMEWLLHEVGHWVAATQEERNLPNFGFGIIRDGECTCTNDFTECRCGDEREWQAWAFQEIILAPFGNSRLFCPPPHRGGIAFYKNESIPSDALRHIEGRLREDRIDVEQWRGVYREWVEWGRSLGANAPWLVG